MNTITMEAIIRREQVVELDKAEVDMKSFSFSTPGRQFHIDFTFMCKSRSRDWIIREGANSAEVLQIIELPRREAYVKLNPKILACYKKAQEIIREELRSWPIWEREIQKLIDTAIHKATEMVERAPPHHNYIALHFPIKVSYENVYDVDEAVRLATEWSIGEDVGMIPATESSIESLKKKTVTEGTNCCVCLDEIIRGCEGLSMPCLHIFHEDCIKEWLNTSHYCPVCRFEMPTD